jgi:hypothetical protein
VCHGVCVSEDLWDAYDRMGLSFQQHAADSAFNAHYDRPAVLAALGPSPGGRSWTPPAAPVCIYVNCWSEGLRSPVGAETCVTWLDAPLAAGRWLLGPAPAGSWDDLRLVGLRLIFLIVTRAVSLLGLPRREWWWKDAEILMLRHQLAVAAREQPRAHSSLTWPDRARLALLAGTVPTGRLAAMRLIVTPARSCAGTAISSAAGGRACRAGAAPGARQRIAGCGRWCCDWPGRTSRGDTGGSTASSRGSASRWHRSLTPLAPRSEERCGPALPMSSTRRRPTRGGGSRTAARWRWQRVRRGNQPGGDRVRLSEARRSGSHQQILNRPGLALLAGPRKE